MTLERATEMYQSGNLRGAWAACEQALDPLQPEAGLLHLMGMIAMARRHFGRAEELLEQAAKLEPEKAMYHCDQALALAGRGEFSRALASLQLALARDPSCVAALRQKAAVLLQLNRAGEALASLRAVASHDDGPQAQLSLAVGLRSLGEIGEARLILERLVADHPENGDAWWLLVGLAKAQPDQHHLDAMTVALDRAKPRVPLLFALAKELEDLNRFPEAFARYQEGNNLKRAQIRYDLDQDRAMFRNLMQQSRPLAPEVPERATRVPIFIVGMPRTGSTLTEQILAAHPEVSAAGELQILGQLAARYSRARGGSYPDYFERLSAEESRQMRRSYLDASRPWRDDSFYFIDKMPLNFLYLPLIASLFPDSPIIHVRRHAVDTCLSNYRQLFGDYYRFSYQLEELGHWYLMYARLMDHWDKLMPGRIMDLEYEALVADPRNQVNRLLAHCGLEWAPECMRHEGGESGVLTPSAVEVRKPIHRGAIGRWQHYRAELGPLLEVLQDGGILVE